MAKIMFLNRKAPHGSIYAWEGLEVVLIFGAFDNELAAVYMDDAVFSLKKGQDTSELGIKGFIQTLPVLEDYGCETILVEKESLDARGMTADDIAIPVQIVDAEAIANLMAEQDVILPF
ncbi:MAG: sulfurtransferase complex subunit TusC [Nitrospirae bacterium]|nr:sulfurtransferase complex subunit TusC [Nitrospirota bacterium]MBI5694576.1 sulfurtransferase complex subunit TusC [Nitrospirota bacterium]